MVVRAAAREEVYQDEVVVSCRRVGPRRCRLC